MLREGAPQEGLNVPVSGSAPDLDYSEPPPFLPGGEVTVLLEALEPCLLEGPPETFQQRGAELDTVRSAGKAIEVVAAQTDRQVVVAVSDNLLNIPVILNDLVD